MSCSQNFLFANVTSCHQEWVGLGA